MKVRVSQRGALIPKRLLGESEEVEVRKRDGIILVLPEGAADPVREFGRSPVECGEPEASSRHDECIYGDKG